mgnify:CR=1 FL=1
MKCRFCGIDQKGQMQFIVGYCWTCLEKTRKSTNLPLEVLVGMLKEGLEIAR